MTLFRVSISLLLALAAIGSPRAAAQLDTVPQNRPAGLESPPPQPDFTNQFSRESTQGRFVLIPISGQLGVDVTPEAIDLLASQISGSGATAVVLDIDADGGSDEAGIRIARRLAELGKSVPVYVVVHRAIGASALLTIPAKRVFIAEPAPPGSVIAFQPQVDPVSALSIDEMAAKNKTLLAELAPIAGREHTLAALTGGKPNIDLSAKQAYAIHQAEPLEGGLAALGRALRIDPWVGAGKQADVLMRRQAMYAQQVASYRARLTGRAFLALSQVNDAIGQLPGAEDAALAADPRRADPARSYRVEWTGQRWELTDASDSAWRKAVDSSLVAWQRVISLADSAEDHLLQAKGAIASLQGSVSISPTDPALSETLERLETARGDLTSRVAAMKAARSRAQEQIAALSKLKRRFSGSTGAPGMGGPEEHDAAAR